MAPILSRPQCVNTLRPIQYGRHFTYNTFKHIFLNENVRILIEISLKFVPKGPINNIPVLVQIMAWRRPGDKPLFEPMVVSLLTHICVTRPQWVKAGYGMFTGWGVGSWDPGFDPCSHHGGRQLSYFRHENTSIKKTNMYGRSQFVWDHSHGGVQDRGDRLLLQINFYFV